MKKPSLRKRSLSSFTLVELLVVMAIIALLVGISQPAFQGAINTARSIKCAANLRSIGMAVTTYATDNNNTLPQIDQAALPIYTPTAQGLVGALGPYGITSNVILCPTDVAQGSAAACNNASYPNPGSSYEWDPVFDNEVVNAPTVYITPTIKRMVTPSHVRLAMDFNRLHHGKSNVVYLDGHVSQH
jgi:prepilin-type N-terminal cleavage/methylation domain-containing protein/prepilin-type processing-associated H-X9-DG protein